MEIGHWFANEWVSFENWMDYHKKEIEITMLIASLILTAIAAPEFLPAIAAVDMGAVAA